MKKLLLVLALILMVITAAYQAQLKGWLRPKKTISKNVSLTIVPVGTYRSAVYAHNAAVLDITVLALRGNDIDTLLIKDYPAFKLRNLSAYSKDFNESIHIPNVVDGKEQIILLYTVTYKAKGSFLKVSDAKWLGKGATNDSLLINI